MSLFRAANSATDADWSVPTPRGPYPVNPAYPDPDGPTQRLYAHPDEPEPLVEPDEPDPADEPGPPARSRGAALALAIAVLALFVSGAAGVLAWGALSRAEGARVDRHPTPALPPAASAAITSPTPAGSTVPAPTGGYAVVYAREPLRIRVPCGSAAFLDLGTPRTGTPVHRADLRYDNACGGDGALLSLGPAAGSGSTVGDPDADAPDCADAVAADPLGARESVPVRAGTVLCVRSGTRLALVEVTDVGPTGTAGLRLTAWSAPDAPPGTPPGTGAPAENVVPSGEATPGE